MRIAAGWNHTIVLTANHDVFTTGLGQNGQLGHGDEDAKTIFTWVKKLGGKNITSIFAGGHHSWCLVDGDTKNISNYNPPSPLRNSPISSPINAGRSQLGRGEGSNETSMIREKKSRNDIGMEHMILHLIFSDQQKSHRFARVTMEEKNKNAFDRAFSEYIKILEGQEGNLVFYNIQKDDDLFQIIGGHQTRNLNHKIDGQLSFTVMLISGALYDSKSRNPENPMIGTKFKAKQTTVGPMYVLSDQEVKVDSYLKSSCLWYLAFMETFAHITKTIKFLELRPGLQTSGT